MTSAGRPRVLMVDSERTWRGGEAQLRLLMKGLRDEGVPVGLAAPPGSEIERRSRDLGVEFHPVGIAGGIDLVAAWRLRAAIRSGKYDIVHSHSSHAHGIAYLACSTLVQRPIQVVSRRVDFPVAKHALSARKYQRGADHYLAISRGVRDVLLAARIPENKISLVPSGIDLSKFDMVEPGGRSKRELGIAAETPVVGNVAALAPHKNHADLIRAAAIVVEKKPDIRFVIVGGGELRGSIESQIAKTGLSGHVIVTGFREDPLALMSMFTCFVLSSYLEGLCTSIMDAQAMGIPVVATNTGGIPDIVEDGVTGLLVPPRDPDALARTILDLLDSPGMRQELAKKALAQSAGYDYHEMVYKTLDAYQSLVAARGGHGMITKGV